MYSFKQDLEKYYKYTIKSNKIHYVSDENPTINVNPDIKDALWLNRETTELFICIDNTPDANIWKGIFGTIIMPTTISKVDIFEDNSAIGLWTFDGHLNDLGGLYNGYLTDRYQIQYVEGKYSKAVRSLNGQVRMNISVLNNLEYFTVSAWLYMERSTTMPFAFSQRYDLYVYGNAIGFNTGCGDLYGIYFPFYENRNKWFHIVVEVHKGDYTLNKMWINGEQQELRQIYGRQCTRNTTFNGIFYVFGWGANRGYRRFGRVDQLRIFNRTLTDDEVLILYNEH